MNAICFVVAGVVRATLPSGEFTLAWTHSVEQTRWEERYRIDRGELLLAEARIQGLGAGMEPPPVATFAGGWWKWQPLSHVSELRLTQSGYTRDYVVCSAGTCHALGALVGDSGDGVVVVKPCAAA